MTKQNHIMNIFRYIIAIPAGIIGAVIIWFLIGKCVVIPMISELPLTFKELFETSSVFKIILLFPTVIGAHWILYYFIYGFTAHIAPSKQDMFGSLALIIFTFFLLVFVYARITCRSVGCILDCILVGIALIVGTILLVNSIKKGALHDETK